MNNSTSRFVVDGVDFDDLEAPFNESIGAFLSQVRHMSGLRIPELQALLSVSKKTYLDMEKGCRQYRMHLLLWWCFVMGLSPLHLLAQSGYFEHLPIGDYRNIRQIKLALLLHRLTPEQCLQALGRLIDRCPRTIQRDVDPSLVVSSAELASLRRFFFARDYYQMVARLLKRFQQDNRLTSEQFSRFLGVTPRTLRRIFNAQGSMNYTYYARFYLSSGVYPLRIAEEGPYLKTRLKLEQRFYLINELIAGYGSSPEFLDTQLARLAQLPPNPDWKALFKRG
jgi:transcriptional regulator with XRE-family HTH domain